MEKCGSPLDDMSTSTSTGYASIPIMLALRIFESINQFVGKNVKRIALTRDKGKPDHGACQTKIEMSGIHAATVPAVMDICRRVEPVYRILYQVNQLFDG